MSAPSSWGDPSLEARHHVHQPSWFEIFLPLPAILLLILLWITLPLILLTAVSLFAPVFDFVQSLLLPINAGITYTSLPVQLLIKIIVFSVLTFTGLTLLLLKLSCLYHEVWSHFFRRPDARHCVYHADQQASMVALFNWNLFRWATILGPTLGWLLASIIAGAGLLWFTNSFSDVPLFNFQLQMTLGLFVMLALGFMTFLAICRGIGTGVQTVLGDVAAITEPEKPTQIILDRSRKIAFTSGLSLVLYPAYFLFYLGLLAEVVALVSLYDIQDVLNLKPDVLSIVYGCTGVTLILFILLSALKFMTYHDALSTFYKRTATGMAS